MPVIIGQGFEMINTLSFIENAPEGLEKQKFIFIAGVVPELINIRYHYNLLIIYVKKVNVKS